MLFSAKGTQHNYNYISVNGVWLDFPFMLTHFQAQNMCLEMQFVRFSTIIVKVVSSEQFPCFWINPTHFGWQGVMHTALMRVVWLWDWSHTVVVASGKHLEERHFMCCFQETGLYEYKVFGVLNNCNAELCAEVYMDLTYRKNWDTYVKGNKKTKIKWDSHCHSPFHPNQLSLIIIGFIPQYITDIHTLLLACNTR